MTHEECTAQSQQDFLEHRREDIETLTLLGIPCGNLSLFTIFLLAGKVLNDALIEKKRLDYTLAHEDEEQFAERRGEILIGLLEAVQMLTPSEREAVKRRVLSSRMVG